ncbi:MAG: phenylalanine--tRNA ligase subunit beta [Chromatiaceae bacterium]|nr:MAG: phenylalanine--tRNA ligase subunit beta [Chromatiaceae bacterium]
MRFSEAWLREWVDPPVNTPTLVEQLTMAGLEVDALVPVAPPFSGVVVGAVMSVTAHPDAAKLHLCQVDAGTGEQLQIVCGAPNVVAGMRVPVALIGARLPGDLRIKRAKLRGVESRGMICSAAELGLAETSDGILGLPADAQIGRDLRDWLALDDQAIEVDLTPDRGDCLSVAGIAREVGVLNQLPVSGPDLSPVAPVNNDRQPVELLAGAACPRYLCRIVRGVDATAPTPLWMRERLRRSGVRPLSAVVDVTNYVLLELGQPLHAFDLDRLAGSIQVRMAVAGEQLTLLNGDTPTLREDTLIIADTARPLAMAGIMGGADSAVSADTRDILLESAFFNPTAISGRARGYGLHTDSSHRFERGVDPNLQARALERATRLLLEICGGAPGPVVSALAAEQLPALRRLHLRRARIAAVLGLDLDGDQVSSILTRLGLTLTATAAGWEATVPSHRFDLQREVDLIAELGRVHGYDQIPITHASSAAVPRANPEMAFDLERARLALVARGYHEAITYSFVSPEFQALIDPAASALALANPLSADLGMMRTSLWPGLIQAARHNLARQQTRVRLFESGLRFRQQPDGLAQEPMLAGIVVGPVLPEQWGTDARPADFFDLKADLEAVVRQAGGGRALSLVRPTTDTVTAVGHPALHPGQSAGIECDGVRLGWIGSLHPALTARLELPPGVQLFELATAGLSDGARPAFMPLSRFPSVRRDLAIVVDARLSFAAVRASVEAAAGELLRELVLFDVYQGEHIEAGHRSMALGLILQDTSQTLTDDVVEQVRVRVVARLAADHGARLRA